MAKERGPWIVVVADYYGYEGYGAPSETYGPFVRKSTAEKRAKALESNSGAWSTEALVLPLLPAKLTAQKKTSRARKANTNVAPILQR